MDPRPYSMSARYSILVLLLAAACSSATSPADKPPNEIASLPRTLTVDEREVIAASNSFGLSLLRELNRTRADSNLFISPLSASMALGMTMNGTAGQTFDEMRSTLGFGTVSLDKINASYSALISTLRALDPAVDVRIANAIWFRAGFPVDATFDATTK